MIGIFGAGQIKSKGLQILEKFNNQNNTTEEENKDIFKEVSVFDLIILFFMLVLYVFVVIWAIVRALKVTEDKGVDSKVLHLFLAVASPLVYVLITLLFI